MFLKEIGDLNRLAQKGLLLLLGKLEKYSVRLVCVTSTPLAGLAAQGVYEPRLYEQLSGLCINVPALREHREDIPNSQPRYSRATLNRARFPCGNSVPLRSIACATMTGLEILRN